MCLTAAWAGVRASRSEDTSEDSLIPLGSTTHLIKTVSWKPINKLGNKRKTGWSQADFLQSPSKVYMTCVQKVLVLNPVAANPFISQRKWDFWQCRKIYSLSCIKWKYYVLQKKIQPSKQQKQPDMFMNTAVIFFSVRGSVIINSSDCILCLIQKPAEPIAH